MQRDSAHIDRLNQQAWDQRHADIECLLRLSQEAYALATAPERYPRGQADSQRNLAWYHLQTAAYDEALAQGLAALRAYQQLDDVPQQIALAHIIGHVYNHLGDYSQSLAHYLDALRLSRTHGQPSGEAQALNHLGIVYGNLGDYATAQDHFARSEALFDALGDHKGVADTLQNQGIICQMQDTDDSALDLIERSLTIFEALGEIGGQAGAHASLGEIYLKHDSLDQAQAHFERALGLAHTLGQCSQIEAAHIQLARVCRLRGDFEAARVYLTRALAKAEAGGSNEQLRVAHREMAALERACGDDARALDHYEQFHHYSEAIFNREADMRLKSLRVAHEVETARREAEISAAQAQHLSDEIEVNRRLISDLDAYAHTVAHDLKNPLMLIVGNSQMLMLDLEGRLAPPEEERLRNIYRTGLKMRHIVQELLLLASVRREEVTLMTLNTRAILRDVELRLNYLINETGAELVYPPSWPGALGHAPWVEEIWYNYISNAIKYGGTPPRVELGADIEPGGIVRFWVRDNGPGLGPAAAAALFQPYPDQRNPAKGDGLGLSIVRRIVEKLGGQAAVTSSGQPGEGCTFSFTLPATRR